MGAFQLSSAHHWRFYLGMRGLPARSFPFSLSWGHDTSEKRQAGGKNDPSEPIRALQGKLRGESDASARSISVGRACGGATRLRALAGADAGGAEFRDHRGPQLHVKHGGGTFRLSGAGG